jgi:hypothetical protein
MGISGSGPWRALRVERKRADEYASLIADWVAGGYRAEGRWADRGVMSPATDGGSE